MEKYKIKIYMLSGREIQHYNIRKRKACVSECGGKLSASDDGRWCDPHRTNKTEIQNQAEKIAATVYEYQVDCDGEWGESYFDFERGRQKILWFSDGYTTKSRIYAKRVIDFLLKQGSEELPK